MTYRKYSDNNPGKLDKVIQNFREEAIKIKMLLCKEDQDLEKRVLLKEGEIHQNEERKVQN